jgi:hypothetical protein
MTKAYNFLFSWQLFPEMCTYNEGVRPKSGTYKINSTPEKKLMSIEMNWVSIENNAFSSTYEIIADEEIHPFYDQHIAEKACITFIDSHCFEVSLYTNDNINLKITHQIMPNGYLKLIEEGKRNDGSVYQNEIFYHKQMSVLPYSSSTSGAIIRPTEEGVIRHKALTSMEEQTNIQLAQIREQVELLAKQAQEIHKRKELSMLIYSAKLNFIPVIGQHYYLYEKKDNSYILSLVGPNEWGANSTYKNCCASVKLLADHTWMEIA